MKHAESQVGYFLKPYTTLYRMLDSEPQRKKKKRERKKRRATGYMEMSGTLERRREKGRGQRKKRIKGRGIPFLARFQYYMQESNELIILFR